MKPPEVEEMIEVADRFLRYQQPENKNELSAMKYVFSSQRRGRGRNKTHDRLF